MRKDGCTLIEELRDLLGAAPGVEARLHDGIQLRTRHRKRRIGSKAIETMPAEFVGCSTAEEIDALDTVSGATVTSNALKEAVKAAMGL